MAHHLESWGADCLGEADILLLELPLGYFSAAGCCIAQINAPQYLWIRAMEPGRHCQRCETMFNKDGLGAIVNSRGISMLGKIAIHTLKRLCEATRKLLSK